MATKLAVTPKLCKVGKSLLKRQMPKKYPQWKIDLGKEIVNTFTDNPKVLVFHYNAMKSDEWSDLRYELRQENVAVKVYPNTLLKKYLENTIYKNVSCLFWTNTAVALFGDANMKAVLKIFKNSPKIELLGGKIDNTLMNSQQIEQYAKLPSLEQLHGQLIQLLSSPSQQLTRLLRTNQSNLSMSLEQYTKQFGENNERS